MEAEASYQALLASIPAPEEITEPSSEDPWISDPRAETLEGRALNSDESAGRAYQTGSNPDIQHMLTRMSETFASQLSAIQNSVANLSERVGWVENTTPPEPSMH